MFVIFLLGAGLGEVLAGSLAGGIIASVVLCLVVVLFFLYPWWVIYQEAQIGMMTNFLPRFLLAFAVWWALFFLIRRVWKPVMESLLIQLMLPWLALAMLAATGWVVGLEMQAFTQLKDDRAALAAAEFQRDHPMPPVCSQLIGRKVSSKHACLSDPWEPGEVAPEDQAWRVGRSRECAQGRLYELKFRSGEAGSGPEDNVAGHYSYLIGRESGAWRRYELPLAYVVREGKVACTPPAQ